jgi:hypothetical protein
MKKILFSIGFLGMVFTANSQSLFTEDFNALNTGNLASDFSANTPGQNDWYYYSGDANATANFATIISGGISDKSLKITGPATPSTTSSPRFALHLFDWSTRDAGNDILFTSYKMNTGPASASTNTFRTVVYDSKGKIIIGLSYQKNTKEMKAVLYDSLGSAQGQYGTFPVQLGGTNSAPSALTLTDNTVYDLAFAYNRNTGVIYVFGQDMQKNLLFEKAYARTYPNSKIGDPSEFDTYVIPGTANNASSYVTYDDIDVHANLCLFFDRKEDASFTYLPISVCKQSVTSTPTITDPAVTGTFSSTSGLSITAATGAIATANSTSGVYPIKFKTNGSTGCVDSTTINFTIKDLPSTPVIKTSGATTFCQGGTVTLSVDQANGTTYAWSNSSTGISTTVSSANSYTVTATSNGCTSTSAPTVVTVNPIASAPVITAATSATFCQGNSVLLNVTSPVSGVIYTWSNNSTGSSLSATTAADYTVTATNPGCTPSVASNSITVTVNPAPAKPTIQASGATSFCDGESVDLSITPVQNTTYLWSNNSTSNSITNITSSNTYTVTATLNGCSTSSETTTVTVNTKPSTPVITAATATTFCSGNSVSLNVSSPVSGVTYTWSNNSTGSSLSASTTDNYSVTASKGVCNSSSSNTIPVTVNTAPTKPSIQASAISFCQGGSVDLSVTPANNTTYKWSNNSTDNSINVTSSNTYTVTATSNGCSSTSDQTTVTAKAPPTIPTINKSGSTTFCIGGSVTLSVSPASGTTYVWSTNATTNSIVASSAASYTVTATSTNGCSSTSLPENVTLSSNTISTPVISALGTTTFCSGNSVVLSITPDNGTTYTWSNNATGSSITATTGGDYTVTATSNACTATSSKVTVTVASSPTKPSITAFGSTTFCDGGNVTLSITPESGAIYEWSYNNLTGNTINTTKAGIYVVTATKGSCTATSNPINVTVNAYPAKPVVSVSGATTLCQGKTSILSVVPVSNTTYLWSNTETGASVTVTQSGDYSVTATSNSCSMTSSPVKMDFLNCAGIEEATISSFTIYPNPSNDVISVSFSELTSKNGTIRFISADGKLIESREYTNSSVETFDVKSLNPGVYFLQIDNSIEKVIVQ